LRILPRSRGSALSAVEGTLAREPPDQQRTCHPRGSGVVRSANGSRRRTYAFPRHQVGRTAAPGCLAGRSPAAPASCVIPSGTVSSRAAREDSLANSSAKSRVCPKRSRRHPRARTSRPTTHLSSLRKRSRSLCERLPTKDPCISSAPSWEHGRPRPRTERYPAVSPITCHPEAVESSAQRTTPNEGSMHSRRSPAPHSKRRVLCEIWSLPRPRRRDPAFAGTATIAARYFHPSKPNWRITKSFISR
jgi:hypothetical protein